MNIERLRRDAYGYLSTQHEIIMQFRNVVKGVNFITPETVGYVAIENGVAEITTGSKFLDNEMWGITVVINNQKRDDLCRCLHSWKDVKEYIETLKPITKIEQP